MSGVSLSRWTMSYFATALVFLVVAEAMMAFGYGYPGADLRAPETLVLVHVAAIGWLSLLMCGALIQFVPVLVAKPLHSNRTPLPALLCLVAGLLALILGFLHLAGQVDLPKHMFACASGLLGLGFGLLLWNLTRTMWTARPLPLSARFVAVGLASVGFTASFGIIFALVLGGFVTAEPFLAVTSSGVPLHAVAALGGWLTFTAMGVSYRLLAMFMLAPELDGRRTHGVLYLGSVALAIVVVAGTLGTQSGGDPELVLAAAGLPGFAAAALYAADVVQLYRARKRRMIELNSRMAALALASLAASVLLIVVLLALGGMDEHAGAVVFLVAFGWLSGLGLAKLYKIVAFLTWLECYGPVLGKTATPRVQDLVVESRAVKWFAIYFLATWGATIALLVQQNLAFRLAAAAMPAATVGIVMELVRTRRLADVTADNRLPAGARRPYLFLSLARQD